MNKGAKAERDVLAEYIVNKYPNICPYDFFKCHKKGVLKCDMRPDKQCWILWARNEGRKAKREAQK